MISINDINQQYKSTIFVLKTAAKMSYEVFVTPISNRSFFEGQSFPPIFEKFLPLWL